jgi:hypothetical protein
MTIEHREWDTGGMLGMCLAFLAGAAVGAAAALLTTTKTGPEMRATIRDWAKGFGDGESRHDPERPMTSGYDRPAGT